MSLFGREDLTNSNGTQRLVGITCLLHAIRYELFASGGLTKDSLDHPLASPGFPLLLGFPTRTLHRPHNSYYSLHFDQYAGLLGS